MVLANLLGPDTAIVLLVLALLFGGSQLPKLARSLGSASHEFRKGVEDGGSTGDPSKESAKESAQASEEKPGS